MLAEMFSDRQTFNLLMSLMVRSIKRMLGEEPTLESWQQLLQMLMGRGFKAAGAIADTLGDSASVDAGEISSPSTVEPSGSDDTEPAPPLAATP